MKCEICGKNEVAFLSSVNGRERRLCAACAVRYGDSLRMRGQRGENSFRNVLDDERFNERWDGMVPVLSLRIFGDRLFGGELFDDFFARMPALGHSRKEDGQTEPPFLEPGLEVRFTRMRRRNELTGALERAVAAERYERAAELRDALRDLDSEG